MTADCQPYTAVTHTSMDEKAGSTMCNGAKMVGCATTQQQTKLRVTTRTTCTYVVNCENETNIKKRKDAG